VFYLVINGVLFGQVLGALLKLYKLVPYKLVG